MAKIKCDIMQTTRTQLKNRMFAAMTNILMTEIGRRTREKTASQRSPRNLKAAERLIKKALLKAEEAYPVPISITLSHVLFQNPLTAGLVKRERKDLLKYIRYLICCRLPQGSLIAETYRMLQRGEKVEEEKLRAARRPLYTLQVRQAAKAGISEHLLKEFGFSLYQALMEAFPRFGLVREGFSTQNWSTPEMSIRNVRYRVFENNPGLKEEVERAEEILKTGQEADPNNARFIFQVRSKILRLITAANLAKWRLGAYRHQDYFDSTEKVVEKCFPFATHPFLYRFIDESGTKIKDLQRIYAFIRSNSRTGTLDDALDGFENQFYQNRQVGKYFLRRHIVLSRRELLDVFLLLVVDREATQAKLTEDLRGIRKRHGSINEDVVKFGCPLVIQYSLGLFEDLFGMSCERYLKIKLNS